MSRFNKIKYSKGSLENSIENISEEFFVINYKNVAFQKNQFGIFNFFLEHQEYGLKFLNI